MFKKPSIKDISVYYRELNDYYIELVGWLNRKKAFIEGSSQLDREYYSGKIKYLIYEKRKKRFLGKYAKSRDVIDNYNIEIKRIISFAQKKIEQINLIILSDNSIENLLKNSKHLKYADIERLRHEVLELELKKEKLDKKLLYNEAKLRKERETDLIKLEAKEEKDLEVKEIKNLHQKFLFKINDLFKNINIDIQKIISFNKKEKVESEKQKKKRLIKEDKKVKLDVISKESLTFFEFIRNYVKVFGYNINLVKDAISYLFVLGYWNLINVFGNKTGFTNKDIKNIQIEKRNILKESRSLSGGDKKLQEESLKELNKNIDHIKSDNLRDEVSFLDAKTGGSNLFSQLSPVSNMFVRRISSLIVKKFPILFRGLYDDLRAANISLLSISYLSIAIFSSIIGGFIAFIIGLIFIRTPFGITYLLNLLLIILAGILVFFGFFMMYPKIVRDNRKKDIDKNLPFGLINFSALVGSDANITDVFKSISEQKDLGEFANEFEKIYKYIFYFGYDITQALNFAAVTTPSDTLEDFIEGFLTTFESGGDLKLFVSEKTEDVIDNYELKQEKNVQKMSTISDVYTAIMIAAPLFLVAILSMVGMLGGEIGGFPIGVVIGFGTYIAIPALNIAFLIFIAGAQQDD